MKFAKIVFWIAAVWGVLVLTPLYFMFNLIGKNDPPAITHPGFFYDSSEQHWPGRSHSASLLPTRYASDC